jgi:hypothetical protein
MIGGGPPRWAIAPWVLGVACLGCSRDPGEKRLPGRRSIPPGCAKLNPANNRPSYTAVMATRYTGPGMTLANMRTHGVLSIDITCVCGREAIIDVSDLSGSIEVPALRSRLRCTECGGRPINVRPDWSQHRAPGSRHVCNDFGAHWRL